MEFKKYYPSELYDEISYKVETKDYYPLTEVYSSIGILKIQEYIKINNIINNKNNIENWFDEISSEEAEENKRLQTTTNLLSKYNTGRIDIKNFGDEKNSIK